MSRIWSCRFVAKIAAVVASAVVLGCGATPPPAPMAKPAPSVVATASALPPVKPLDCATLCQKANTVVGCTPDPANIPACVDLCTRLRDGACKGAVEAELACVAKIVALACTPEGVVDWGSCDAEHRAANECARAS